MGGQLNFYSNDLDRFCPNINLLCCGQEVVMEFERGEEIGVGRERGILSSHGLGACTYQKVIL